MPINVVKKKEVVDILVDTTKEDELLGYIVHEKYCEISYYNELDEDYDKKKDDDLDFLLKKIHF